MSTTPNIDRVKQAMTDASASGDVDGMINISNLLTVESVAMKKHLEEQGIHDKILNLSPELHRLMGSGLHPEISERIRSELKKQGLDAAAIDEAVRRVDALTEQIAEKVLASLQK